MTRAIWDYYKIVGTIPLEEDEDDGEAQAPKANGRPLSFTMVRLEKVAKQRVETAETFEDPGDILQKELEKTQKKSMLKRMDSSGSLLRKMDR